LTGGIQGVAGDGESDENRPLNRRGRLEKL
jgi:hypothetical protein